MSTDNSLGFIPYGQSPPAVKEEVKQNDLGFIPYEQSSQSSQSNKSGIDVLEPLRSLDRIGQKTLASAVTAAVKSIGSVLESDQLGEKYLNPPESVKKQFPSIGPSAKELGATIKESGESVNAYLLDLIENYSGKSSSSAEDFLTKSGERAGKLFGNAPSQAIALGSAIGGTLGQTAEELGAPKWTQDVLEIASLFGKPFYNYAKGKLASRINPKTVEDAASTAAANRSSGEPPGGSAGSPSGFTKSENLLTDLQKAEQQQIASQTPAQPKEPLGGIRPQPIGRAANESSLAGRVTPGGQDIGIRPAPTTAAEPTLANRVGNSIYPQEIYNTTRAGFSAKNEIMAADERAYNNVRNLYNTAREENQVVSTIHPDLAHDIQTMVDKLDSIPKLSSVETQLNNYAKSILNEIADVQNGSISGYKPINNQILIDQIQSINRGIDFDFAHGNPKNIFKPLTKLLKDSVEHAANSTGHPQAAQAITNANRGYAEWTTTYNNDYINPYRDRSNRDYSKLFKRNTDIDNFNATRHILNETEVGREIVGGTQREIVDKKLGKFFENPRKQSQVDFDKNLRELEYILSPEQTRAIETAFRDSRVARPLNRNVSKVEKQKPIKTDLKALERYTKSTPEDIQKLMNSRSGIRQLRADASKTAKGKEFFDRVAQDKVADILREGKVKPKYTGNDLYKVLNKKSNYELIEELTSPEMAKDLLDQSKEIADRIITKENAKKLAVHLTKLKIFKFFITSGSSGGS